MHLITLDSALKIAFSWAFPQIKFNILKRIYNGLTENGLFFSNLLYLLTERAEPVSLGHCQQRRTKASGVVRSIALIAK